MSGRNIRGGWVVAMYSGLYIGFIDDGSGGDDDSGIGKSGYDSGDGYSSSGLRTLAVEVAVKVWWWSTQGEVNFETSL